MEEIIQSQLRESAEVKIKTAELISPAIAEAVHMVVEAFKKGGKLLLIGNGGSAADAQHIAGEFVGKFKKERKPLPALALTTNSSILTALGNDFGYDSIFSRAVEALANHPEDILVAITTSGNSSSIIKAVESAKAMGIKTIALTGRGGGKIRDVVDLALIVPSDNTQRIQETHITIGHIICDLVERELFTDTPLTL